MYCTTHMLILFMCLVYVSVQQDMCMLTMLLTKYVAVILLLGMLCCFCMALQVGGYLCTLVLKKKKFSLLVQEWVENKLEIKRK